MKRLGPVHLFVCLLTFALAPWTDDEPYSPFQSSLVQRDAAVYSRVDEKCGLFMCSPFEHYVCLYLFCFFMKSRMSSVKTIICVLGKVVYLHDTTVIVPASLLC